MLTKYMWDCYIGENTGYFSGTFENDYFILFCCIILTPFTVCVDLITSPIQILTKCVGKILEIRFSGKKEKWRINKMDNIYIIHTNKPLGRFRKWLLRKIGCRFVGDNQV